MSHFNAIAESKTPTAAGLATGGKTALSYHSPRKTPRTRRRILQKSPERLDHDNQETNSGHSHLAGRRYFPGSRCRSFHGERRSAAGAQSACSGGGIVWWSRCGDRLRSDLASLRGGRRKEASRGTRASSQAGENEKAETAARGVTRKRRLSRCEGMPHFETVQR